MALILGELKEAQIEKVTSLPTDNKKYRIVGYNGDLYFHDGSSYVKVTEQSSSPTFQNVTVYGNIAITGTVDGRDVSTDGTAQDTHIASATGHVDVQSNNTHRASNGTDHSYIDQDVTAGATPTFDNLNIDTDVNVSNDINVTGNIVVAGTVDGRDIDADGTAQDTHIASATGHVDVQSNNTHRASDGKDHSDVGLNNTHRGSAGTDHSDVGLANTHRASATGHVDVQSNNTHRASDGTDHANVVLNDTHRVSVTGHANVVLNDTHRGSAGTDHSDVGLNNTHRTSAGTDHSDVGLNNTHRTSAGTDHSDVGLNNTHRTSAGTDHSDVGLANTHRASATGHVDVQTNNTHRTSDGTDHSYIDQDVTSGTSPTFDVANMSGTLDAFISTPSSAPTSDYEVANKKYVDDNGGGGAGNLDGTDMRLGVQNIGTVDTDVDVYSPTGANYAFKNKLIVSNYNKSEVAKIRVANRNGTLDAEDYLLYDISIGPETQPIGVEIPGMTTADTITVRSSVTGVNFALFGEETETNPESDLYSRLNVGAVDTKETLGTFTGEAEVDFVICNRNAAETAEVKLYVGDGATVDEDIVYQDQILPNQSKVFGFDQNVAANYVASFISSVTGVNAQAYTRGNSGSSADLALPAEVQLKTAAEYGLFTLSADQSSDLAANDPIQFDELVRGNLSIASYAVPLKANKTYRIAWNTFGNAEGHNVTLGIYDVTNSAWISDLTSRERAAGIGGNDGFNPSTEDIYTPSTDVTIQLRVKAVATAVTTMYANETSMIIQEISNLTDYVKNPYQVDYYQTDLTVTGTGWTTAVAKGNAYKTADGNWMLAFTIAGGAIDCNGLALTIAGITFKSGIIQPFFAVGNSSGQPSGRTVTTAGGAIITIGLAGADASCSVNGVAFLDSKPTWI